MDIQAAPAHRSVPVRAMPAYNAREHSLSDRERLVLQLLSQGQSNKQAARTLGISPETIKSHLKNIFVKLDVEKRAQAVCMAQARGLISSAGEPFRSAGLYAPFANAAP